MNAKQIQRALSRNDHRNYGVYADFKNSEAEWSVGHLLMGKGVSFRRIKKATQAIMAAMPRMEKVIFRNSGTALTEDVAKDWYVFGKECKAKGDTNNYWWPKQGEHAMKMFRLSERLNSK